MITVKTTTILWFDFKLEVYVSHFAAIDNKGGHQGVQPIFEMSIVQFQKYATPILTPGHILKGYKLGKQKPNII